ncbi:MAG TPA: hypothetical protein VHC67_00795 [Gaiellaceae bacterium]|jgi:hypothetical protein|nr:hypothetical protein [Gaiellaceae bacterium]
MDSSRASDAEREQAVEALRFATSRPARPRRRRVPRSSSYRELFGTVDLDLRQATLEGPVVELEIFNLFGTGTVLVPEAIAVTVTGQLVEHPASGPLPGAPERRIRVSGLGGTTNVRYREPVSPGRRLLGTADA